MNSDTATSPSVNELYLSEYILFMIISKGNINFVKSLVPYHA
ncbi:hypothetical protein AC40_5278 [Escherichia coli 2-005-03_S3_C3]|nr:hypothetical protein AC40_5278 [Escherichia coli 2-005-03_S3_C3]